MWVFYTPPPAPSFTDWARECRLTAFGWLTGGPQPAGQKRPPHEVQALAKFGWAHPHSQPAPRAAEPHRPRPRQEPNSYG